MRKYAFTVLCCVTLGLNVGCSSTSSYTFSLSPSNRLTKQASWMRQTTPSPQMLPTELQKMMLADYVIEPGDVLRIEMADLDSPVRLPPDQTVMIDGRIDLGPYGRHVVFNKSVDEIEKIVRDAIRSKVKDAGEVNVRVISTDSKTYFVLGEVNSPGEFPLLGRESALNAIVKAGGLTDSADVTKIILSRPTMPCDGRQVMPICYREIVQLGDTSTNYQLRPGDRIFIPSRSFWDALKVGGSSKKCDPCNRHQSLAPAQKLECGFSTECCTPQTTEVQSASRGMISVRK